MEAALKTYPVIDFSVKYFVKEAEGIAEGVAVGDLLTIELNLTALNLEDN